MSNLMKLFCLVVLSILLVSTALSWGNATHMYFAKHLSTKPGPANFNEMYGAVLPDAFNFMFDANGQYLYAQTHENFLPIYTLAWNHHLKEVAFGDLSHNQLFGADWTAHVDGFTSGGGYAVEKGLSLAPSLIPTLITILTDAGLDQYTADAVANGIAPALGHDLSETAVDLLVKLNLDRTIGLQIYLAAQTRHHDVPLLLSAVYAQGLGDFAGMSNEDAAKVIIGSEKEFRNYIMHYGQAFMLPVSKTIALLSAQTAPIAKMYIEAAVGNTITVTVTPEQVAYFISAAISNVQFDYADELSQTLIHLKEAMMPYHVRPFACVRGETTPERELGETTPVQYSLSQNYPNPFNPTTTIQFELPEDAIITLKVYNMLGQEVVTLIDQEMMNYGRQEVEFNAGSLPSGVYSYRLIANSLGDEEEGIIGQTYTSVKQMVLVR